MIAANEIEQKALRLWNSGGVLRAWLGCEELFPLTIAAGKPTAAQLLNQLPVVENWKSSIEEDCQCYSGRGYRIEYAEVNHHNGQQRLPAKLVFDQPTDLIAFINKGSELSRFARLLGLIRQADARLMPWCEQYPLKVLAYEKGWEHILLVLDYLKENPGFRRSQLEWDIPLVDNKFIEQHKLIIDQLLDLVLPAE